MNFKSALNSFVFRFQFFQGTIAPKVSTAIFWGSWQHHHVFLPLIAAYFIFSCHIKSTTQNESFCFLTQIRGPHFGFSLKRFCCRDAWLDKCTSYRFLMEQSNYLSQGNELFFHWLSIFSRIRLDWVDFLHTQEKELTKLINKTGWELLYFWFIFF